LATHTDDSVTVTIKDTNGSDSKESWGLRSFNIIGWGPKVDNLPVVHGKCIEIYSECDF